MEDQTMELDNHLNTETNLALSSKGKKDFRSIANWCLFFSILGIIFSGLMILGGLAMTSVMGAFPGGSEIGGVLTIVYLILGFVYALPVYYLFKFSTKMKGALTRNDTADFNDAINKLKTHFLIMGIFTIVVIVLYVVFAVAMVGGMASGMANEWAL